jgi:hypothetical protein
MGDQLLPLPLTERSIHLCVDMQRIFSVDCPWPKPWMDGALPCGPCSVAEPAFRHLRLNRTEPPQTAFRSRRGSEGHHRPRGSDVRAGRNHCRQGLPYNSSVVLPYSTRSRCQLPAPRNVEHRASNEKGGAEPPSAAMIGALCHAPLSAPEGPPTRPFNTPAPSSLLAGCRGCG